MTSTPLASSPQGFVRTPRSNHREELPQARLSTPELAIGEARMGGCRRNVLT